MTIKTIVKPWHQNLTSKKWRYVSSTSGVFELVGVQVPDCVIRHRGKLLGFVKDNVLTIMAGYAWNGMSFYPEKEENIIDSMIHDFFYQTGLIPRKKADIILKNMSATHDKKSSVIYYGVRLAGWMFYAKDCCVVISPI